MKNQIIKPTTLIREEFISNLTKLINDSHLPAFIIEPILKEMYLEIKVVAQKQYEADKTMYEQSILDSQVKE